MSTTVSGEKKFGSLAAIIISAVIAVIGIGMWGYQNTLGLQITGMRNLSSWGLYITNFMFFVGLSAGGLIISSAPKVFGLQGFGKISKVAVFSSIVCTILAIAFVIIDLGNPVRLWHMIAYTNFTSPLAWDMVVLTCYLLLSIGYLYLLVKADKGIDNARPLKIISIIAFVCAILVHCVTAWIFGLQVARPFWNTALLAPWFVSSALVSGLALVLILVIVLRKFGYLAVENQNLKKMAKLLAIFVLVDLFLFFCDLLTAGYGGAGLEFDLIQTMLFGSFAPFFWTEVLGGLVAAVILFTNAGQSKPGLMILASALAILGIFFKRVQLIEGGFQYPLLSYPGSAGVAAGLPVPGADGFWQSLGTSLAYWPTGMEIGITLGALSLGVCLVLLGLRYLPLGDSAKKIEE